MINSFKVILFIVVDDGLNGDILDPSELTFESQVHLVVVRSLYINAFAIVRDWVQVEIQISREIVSEQAGNLAPSVSLMLFDLDLLVDIGFHPFLDWDWEVD